MQDRPRPESCETESNGPVVLPPPPDTHTAVPVCGSHLWTPCSPVSVLSTRVVEKTVADAKANLGART